MTRLAYAHMGHMLYRCWHYSGGSIVRHVLKDDAVDEFPFRRAPLARLEVE